MSEPRWAPEPGSGLAGPGRFRAWHFPSMSMVLAELQAQTPANVPLLGPRSTALAAGMWGHRCCQSLLASERLLLGHKQPQRASDLIPLHIKSELTSRFFVGFFLFLKREHGVDGETNLVALVTLLQHQPWQMHHVLIRLKTKERTGGLNICPPSALEGPCSRGLGMVFLGENTLSRGLSLTLLSSSTALKTLRLSDAAVQADWFIGSLGWTQ